MKVKVKKCVVASENSCISISEKFLQQVSVDRSKLALTQSGMCLPGLIVVYSCSWLPLPKFEGFDDLTAKNLNRSHQELLRYCR